LSGPEPTPGCTTAPVAGSKRRSWLFLTTVTVLVLLAVVLTGVAVWPRSAPMPPAPPAVAGSTPAPATSHAPLKASQPERLTIPGLDVATPLIDLGLNSDGTVQVPPIEAQAPAGWYRGSPTPGAPGAAVILGHVTVGSYGKGVFYRLGELRAGQQIDVTRADRSTAVFTVVDVAQYSKAHFPGSTVYGGTQEADLRVITCGGPYNAADHSYPDNTVVYAKLTGVR
jgi:sortase (surface protein transpeptidase)